MVSTRKHLTLTWPVYTGMAGCILASVNAKGQTTTYDVDPDIVLDNHLWFYHTDYFEWDADQDGTADFRLGLDFNSSSYSSAYIQPLNDAQIVRDIVELVKICDGVTVADTLEVPLVHVGIAGEYISSESAFDTLQTKVFGSFGGPSEDPDCYFPLAGEKTLLIRNIPVAISMPDGLHYGWLKTSLYESGQHRYWRLYEAVLSDMPDEPVTIPDNEVTPPVWINAVDISDYNDAADLSGSFRPTDIPFAIAEHRVIVVPVSVSDPIDIASLLALPADRYQIVLPSEADSLHFQFDHLKKDLEGNLIHNNTPYRLLVISIPDIATGLDPVLSVYSEEITLRTWIEGATVFLSDDGDDFSPSDFRVQFPPISPETLVSQYRIMLVKSDQLDSWTLEKALDVAESNVLYAAPDNSDHDIHLPDGFMDVDGDMITPWQTYVACLQVVASEVAASDTLAFSAPAMLSHPFSNTDGFHLIQSNGQVMLIAPSDYASGYVLNMYNAAGELVWQKESNEAFLQITYDGRNAVYLLQTIKGSETTTFKTFLH